MGGTLQWNTITSICPVTFPRHAEAMVSTNLLKTDNKGGRRRPSRSLALDCKEWVFWSVRFRPRSVSPQKRWALSPKWEEPAEGLWASVMPSLSGIATALTIHRATLWSPIRLQLFIHTTYKSRQRRHLSLCFFLECMLSLVLFIHPRLSAFWPASFFGWRFLSLFQVSMAKVLLRWYQDCIGLTSETSSEILIYHQEIFSIKARGLKLRLWCLCSKSKFPKSLVCYLCLTDFTVQNPEDWRSHKTYLRIWSLIYIWH